MGSPGFCGANSNSQRPLCRRLSASRRRTSQTNATLNAEINLHEAPNGVYYQFQLVTDPSEFALEILCLPTLQPGYSGCIGPQGSGALPIGFLPGNTLQPSRHSAPASTSPAPG